MWKVAQVQSERHLFGQGREWMALRKFRRPLTLQGAASIDHSHGHSKIIY